MIRIEIKEESRQNLNRYFKQIQTRILQAAREGMQEAMEGLASEAVSEMSAAGIVSRTGQTAAAIKRSPSVTVNDGLIKGKVTSWVGKKPMGSWLGNGVQVPTVQSKLMVFTTADGTLVFTRGHKAFHTTPRPFLNPALHQYEPQIVEKIRAKILGALAQ